MNEENRPVQDQFFTQSLEKQDRIIDELVYLRKELTKFHDHSATELKNVHMALERFTNYLERSTQLEERIAALERLIGKDQNEQ